MVTISKKEYMELMKAKLRYDHLREVLAEDIFAVPPTRSRRMVMKAFRESGKYNQKFLGSLEKGLKHSSYFKA